jgi:hypothetical protein
VFVVLSLLLELWSTCAWILVTSKSLFVFLFRLVLTYVIFKERRERNYLFYFMCCTFTVGIVCSFTTWADKAHVVRIEILPIASVAECVHIVDLCKQRGRSQAGSCRLRCLYCSMWVKFFALSRMFETKIYLSVSCSAALCCIVCLHMVGCSMCWCISTSGLT